MWSPCSKWLAGVSLPACLPGESTAPALQSLTAEELARKEKLVFSNALDALDGFWNGKIHDGFRVTSFGVKDGGSHHTVPAWNDYDTVKEMLKSSLRAIKDDAGKKKLLDEWRYYVKHMDRRRGFVCFRKGACGDEQCECNSNATKATEVMKIPTSDKWLLPPITPCPERPGQYRTFRQQSTALSFSYPDQHMKDVLNEACPKCRYVFRSESDQVRHIKLVHGGARAMSAEADVDNTENPPAK